MAKSAGIGEAIVFHACCGQLTGFGHRGGRGLGVSITDEQTMLLIARSGVLLRFSRQGYERQLGMM